MYQAVSLPRAGSVNYACSIPRLRSPAAVPAVSCSRRRAVHSISRRTAVVVQANEDAELGRSYRRVVYDFEKWIEHRDASRYKKNIMTMFSSRIIRSLAGPLAFVTGVALALCLYELLLETDMLPAGAPNLLLSKDSEVITSFALSLLLVFRTNTSYARFDEARKMWGGILNRTRDIVQQACIFIPDPVARAAMVRWTIACVRALHAHVQQGVDLRKTLAGRLDDAELTLLCSSEHRVVKSLHVMGHILKQQPLGLAEYQAMLANITFYYDALGGCERLLRTPIPVSYTRHTARFLLAWLTILPFSLYESCGWDIIIITPGVAFLLLGIDEIGIQIEEPFGILPIDAICQRAEKDADQIVAENRGLEKFASVLKSTSTGSAPAAKK